MPRIKKKRGKTVELFDQRDFQGGDHTVTVNANTADPRYYKGLKKLLEKALRDARFKVSWVGI